MTTPIVRPARSTPPLRHAGRLASLAVWATATIALTAPVLTAPAFAQADGDMLRHVIRPGDTLSELSQRFLQRPSEWPRIATLNRIADPRRLPVGETLLIPVEMLKKPSRPVSASVAGIRGRVIVTTGGDPAPARMNQTLGEGALIETGPNAHLRLVLTDGSAVAVPSNTRIRIDRLRADGDTGALDRIFTLLQGRVESRVSPVGRGGGYSVRTPVSVSAVRGTDFRSAYDETEGKARTEVLEGGVAVDASGASNVVAPGYGAVASAAGLVVRPLPPAPYLASGGAPVTGENALFDVVPVEGAAAYRLRLVGDTSARDVLMETETPASQARFSLGDLPDGFHVVAISTVSGDGLESARSVYDILRVRNVLRDLSAAPAPGGGWTFSWSSDGNATPRYTFILNRRGESELLVATSGLTDGAASVPALRRGAYEWRVRSSRTVLGQLVDVWSPVQTLTVP